MQDQGKHKSLIIPHCPCLSLLDLSLFFSLLSCPFLSLFCTCSAFVGFVPVLSLLFSETSKDSPFLSLSVSACSCLPPSVLVCPCLSPSVPVCPFLSLSVPSCPFLSLYVPVCPYLSQSIPVCPNNGRNQTLGCFRHRKER